MTWYQFLLCAATGTLGLQFVLALLQPKDWQITTDRIAALVLFALFTYVSFVGWK